MQILEFENMLKKTSASADEKRMLLKALDAVLANQLDGSDSLLITEIDELQANNDLLANELECTRIEKEELQRQLDVLRESFTRA